MGVEWTDEQLEELDKIRQALREEFETNQSSDTRSTALKDIEDLKEDFLDTLKHVCKHSQSDTLRTKIAMWGYDRLLERDKATADPLADLIKGIAEASNAHSA